MVVIPVFALIVILSLLGVYYYKRSTRNAVERFIANDVTINILIAGSNVFNDNKHKFYSVLSIQPGTKKIGLIFLPPDFRVLTDERRGRYQRIDEIDSSDFKSLADSLYHDIKLKIPFYVILYSPDIERLVDLVGGIDLYFLNQAEGIHGTEYGLNYLDGSKTVKYINSAEKNSIFIKYDRIQDILLTLFYNRDKYRKFFNLEFISEVIRTIKTNLLAREIAGLAKILYDEKTELMCSIAPGSYDEDGLYYIDDISYKMYENDYLKTLIKGVDPEQPVKIKILNGTDVSGLAKRTRAFLVREGLNVVEFGTSPFPSQEASVIISQKGNIGPARKVADLLSIDRIYHVIDSTQLNNVLLIIGWDRTR